MIHIKRRYECSKMYFFLRTINEDKIIPLTTMHMSKMCNSIKIVIISLLQLMRPQGLNFLVKTTAVNTKMPGSAESRELR